MSLEDLEIRKYTAPQMLTSAASSDYTMTEREADGRWIAEVASVPGAMAYGATEADALRNAYAIALTAARAPAPRMLTAGQAIALGERCIEYGRVNHAAQPPDSEYRRRMLREMIDEVRATLSSPAPQETT